MALSHQVQAEIARLYDEGMLTKEIGRRFNLSSASVSYYAKKMGCKMRKKGRKNG